jgi:hypothetical protein
VELTHTNGMLSGIAGGSWAASRRCDGRFRRRGCDDYAVGVLGDVGLVGDEDDGVALGVELVEEAMISTPVLESRLPVGSSARMMEGLLTRARAMATRWRWPPESSLGLWHHAGAEVDVRGLPWRARCARRRGAVVDERQLDVVQRGGAGQQVEGLEDEADFLVADAGELVVVELGDVVAVEPVLALGGRVEAADQVHQGGLAGAGGAHDGDVLVVLDAERDAAQGVTCWSPIS